MSVSRCLNERSPRHDCLVTKEGGGNGDRPQAIVTAVLLALPVALFAGGPGQRAQGRRPAEIRFQGMDTNGDGAISRSEWRGSDQSFQRHDWNGDRVLSGTKVGSAPRAISATKEMITTRPAGVPQLD